MTWAPLQLRGLSFIGPHKAPALLEFQDGLNVICGASETGKSFIAEAIDFLLGSGSPLRDIRERVGYDRARLAFQTADNQDLTLERSTSGGHFSLLRGFLLSGQPSGQVITLRGSNRTTTEESLSNYILSLIGLSDKYLQKNQQGDTQKLSFRNLIKLVLIHEGEITKRSSPILSVQYTLRTAEYSLFKLLLTGVDDSALRVHTRQAAEASNNYQNNRAKAELVDELLNELQLELNKFGINHREAEHRLSILEARFSEQQETLTKLQGDLEERLKHRHSIMDELKKVSGRCDEIMGLVERFKLLEAHYQVDLERLAAIEETGSLFVHLDQKPCPLCGALPDHQHQDEECDGDVESVIQAANSEIAKIKKLSTELDRTIQDLMSEFNVLDQERERIISSFHSLNQEINEIASPLKDVQNDFSAVVRESGEIQRIIEIFNRVEEMERKKASLLAETESSASPVNLQEDPSSPTAGSRVDISTSLLDGFAQKVQQLLQTWNFPGCDRIHFDQTDKDIVIDGQLRTSRGKGLRAITHAAMTIALMEFCKEKNLSHPGFVILDSPLLAYYRPEGSEDSLEGSDLKERFYNYLADHHSNSQVIIIENEHPPLELRERIALTVFTKNPNEGRYGFFLSSDKTFARGYAAFAT